MQTGIYNYDFLKLVRNNCMMSVVYTVIMIITILLFMVVRRLGRFFVFSFMHARKNPKVVRMVIITYILDE